MSTLISVESCENIRIICRIHNQMNNSVGFWEKLIIIAKDAGIKEKEKFLNARRVRRPIIHAPIFYTFLRVNSRERDSNAKKWKWLVILLIKYSDGTFFITLSFFFYKIHWVHLSNQSILILALFYSWDEDREVIF